jgi:hypothetical protein
MRLHNAVLGLAWTAIVLTSATALATSPPVVDAELTNPERMVAALYDEVTFGAGASPDWQRVRSMFLDRATIVLRTGREQTTVFSVDGFIADFVAFSEREDVRASGFAERVLRTDPLVFGDIAHILVLYEAHIPGSERPPLQGVDSFQLIRKDGRWWITGVTNELPTAERPLPPALADAPGRAAEEPLVP